MSEELKRCPFCGSEAELFKVEKMGATSPDDELEAYYIVCSHCSVQIRLTGELSDAIAEWNRRVDTDVNTRLIAHAPEMYELLKAVANYKPDTVWDVVSKAKELLARIDGKELKH